MKKRMFWMLLSVAVVLAAIGAVKVGQVQAAIAHGASFVPPPEAVTTVVSEVVDWPSSLHAVATVKAVQGVTVSADLPGLVERIAFDSGHWVKAGTVLVELDTRQEEAQLAAAEAQRDLARLTFDRIVGLREQGVTSQAESDRAIAELRSTEAAVGEILATIERKTIRAPFAGVLGIRQVDLGQYLAPGDPVVALQSLDPVHVDFGAPQQEVAHLAVGDAVRVTLESEPGADFAGRISAIDSIVDDATRNVLVRATVPNVDGRLRPGMFVEAFVDRGGHRSVVALPASAISYAPYGDSVFVVEDLEGPDGATYRGVRQQFVELGGSRGDQVAVLDGLTAGQEVVSSGVFKLRSGAAVLVNNAIQPANDPAPRPEDS